MTAKPDFISKLKNVDWAGPDDPAYGMSGLIHCARMPAAAGPQQRVPAVVMVHGWGGNESVMWIFDKAVPPGVAVITPRAPIDIGDSGHVWYRGSGQNMYPHLDAPQIPDENTLLDALESMQYFLDNLPQLYPLDPAQIVLLGFSQGAAMVGALAQQRPHAAIGVAVLAGFWIQAPGVTPHDSLMAALPMFIAHGTQDTIISPAAGQHARDTYTRLGANVTYHEYPVAHKMSAQGIRDLAAWLAEVFTSPAA